MYLDDDLGLIAFSCFLRKEYSDENLSFWVECNKLEKIEDLQLRQHQINDVFDKYIR